MKLGVVSRRNSDSVAPAIKEVWRASSAWERGRGLLGRPPLQKGQALWIKRCSSVHTVGMGYPLDLAFLDANGVIKKLTQNLAPLRAAWAYGACATLEMPAGQVEELKLCVGDALQWVSVP
jgi:hypothetical protein